MPMKKSVAAESPDAYLASLSGWQHRYVRALRSTVVGSAPLREAVKWGHLVYFSNGPTLLVRAEESRVLFGFWRGQRLRDIEPTLKAGGKYEMATIELREGMSLADTIVRKLTRSAVALNEELGNPTDAARPAKAKAAPKRKPAVRKSRR
jgi:hypothetical protein